MYTKVFKKNENNKIEFTEKELKETLDSVYNTGYMDGRGDSSYTYYSPYWPYRNSWYYTTATSNLSTASNANDTVKYSITANDAITIKSSNTEEK